MQDDTVSAAAVVLAAASRSSTGLVPHHQQADDRACSATKTRWWSRLKAKLLCFRAPHPHGHGGNPHRIAAYASPEPAQQSTSRYQYHHHTHHATQPAVAFVAPPSSPASSLLTSEAPSPVQVLHLNAANAYDDSSPTASIFAVGPYAREPQQLVTPPTFSAGLTEPSTAPVTPPPEPSLHQLPAAGLSSSSPEVPFARFLSPSFQGHYYQMLLQQPGSPIGGGGTTTTLVLSPVSTSSMSPPPPWMQMHHRCSEEEEGSPPPSGEFVFGSRASGDWTFVEGGELRGRRSPCGSTVSNADDAAEDGGNQQWPFRSSFRN